MVELESAVTEEGVASLRYRVCREVPVFESVEFNSTIVTRNICKDRKEGHSHSNFFLRMLVRSCNLPSSHICGRSRPERWLYWADNGWARPQREATLFERRQILSGS